MKAGSRVLLASALCIFGGALRAQITPNTPIPAQTAVALGCKTDDISSGSDTARNDPEWVPILKDPRHPFPNDVTILEGRVLGANEKFASRAALPKETETDQSPSEVAEEDLPWNHFTHDKTMDVVPDPPYEGLLSSFVKADGSIGVRESMEVEWENAGASPESGGSPLDMFWGGLPEFAWASANDRVWVAGRWIFDCGHPGSNDPSRVAYETEIHPPRAMVVFRLNHPLSLQATGGGGDQGFGGTGPATWLPITGGATSLPVTEADIFVSGNGGGANDLCNLINRNISIGLGVQIDDCTPTNPVIPVNDRNYVFDIYPPGTDFNPQFKQLHGSGNYPVFPPSPAASLQWKMIDRALDHPNHACGEGPIKNDPNTGGACITVQPILCLLDDSTPPPTQQETGCPAAPSSPTRLRVILPFLGSNANYFAQSIVLGWDDPPAAPNQTYLIRLHKYTVIHNGEGPLTDGDWRVFADVGGQWRALSQAYDTDGQGNNLCHGSSLIENGDGDCFQFDKRPWLVSVPPGMPIHVSLGGYESDRVDGYLCYQEDNYFTGGQCQISAAAGAALFNSNDDRLGNMEFDLDPNQGYQQVVPGSATFDVQVNGLTLTTTKLDQACKDAAAVTSTNPDCSKDGTQYQAQFTVTPLPTLVPPTSSALAIGSPNYTNPTTKAVYVGASTPLTVSTNSTGNVGFQFRSIPDNGPVPSYSIGLPFPVRWYWSSFGAGPRRNVSLPPGFLGDGGYTIQHSAEVVNCADFMVCGVTEPRHSSHVILDTTPPRIRLWVPAATQYSHSGTLTLLYGADDGAGSGIASLTAKLDGSPALPDGHRLAAGQTINLLTELPLGPHTFSVASADHVGNAGSTSVSFTIIATPAAIEDDVNQFLAAGDIKSQAEANSLLAKLHSAAAAYAAANCTTASNFYRAFNEELSVQAGKGIGAVAARIMLADAQYLIGHCPH